MMRQGFTLIELVIVMVAVAILAVLAIPSYKLFVLKSQRVDAIVSLTEDQAILERCYAQNFSYTGTCSSLPSFPHASEQGYYTVRMSNLTSTTYTLTAIPTGTQTADTTCASMSVTQTNQKTAVDSGGTSQTSCWSP